MKKLFGTVGLSAMLLSTLAQARLMVKTSPEDLDQAKNTKPPKAVKIDFPDIDKRGFVPIAGPVFGSRELKEWMNIDDRMPIPNAESEDELIRFMFGFGIFEALDEGGFRRYGDLDSLLQSAPSLMKEAAMRDVKEFKGCKIPDLKLSPNQLKLVNEIKAALQKGNAKDGEDGVQIAGTVDDYTVLSFLHYAKAAVEHYQRAQVDAMITDKLRQNGCNDNVTVEERREGFPVHDGAKK